LPLFSPISIFFLFSFVWISSTPNGWIHFAPFPIQLRSELALLIQIHEGNIADLVLIHGIVLLDLSIYGLDFIFLNFSTLLFLGCFTANLVQKIGREYC
jgi:hypothetical protein